MRNLFIFFPQWQGSGTTDELYGSALLIKETISQYFKFLDVPVSTKKQTVTKNGILMFDNVLSQFEYAKELIENNNPEKIFTLGGDCSVEIAPVSYLNKKQDSQFAVVWFDAHGDLNTPESSPSQTFHGMSLRALLGDGEKTFIGQITKPLTCDQIILAGARDLDNPELEYIEKNGVKWLNPDQIENNRILLAQTIREMGADKIYIHLDLDVIEPREFPEVKCPTSSGLLMSSLIDQINKLKSRFEIIGASIVEYSTNRKECDSRILELAKLLFT